MTDRHQQQYIVKHFISVCPEEHVATRARLVRSELIDDVTFFAEDKVMGVLCIPAGEGPKLCEQMGLIERTRAVGYEEIKQEFEQLLSATR